MNYQNKAEFSYDTTVQKLLIAGTAIAGLNSFERGDYNIALLPLVYLILEKPSQIKDYHTQIVRMVFLVIFSLFLDILWFFYWSGEFSYYLDFKQYSWMTLPIHLTMIFTIFGFLIKIGVVYFLHQADEQGIQQQLNLNNALALGQEFFNANPGAQQGQNQYRNQSQYNPQQDYNHNDNNNNNFQPPNPKGYQSNYQEY